MGIIGEEQHISRLGTKERHKYSYVVMREFEFANYYIYNSVVYDRHHSLAQMVV